MYQVKWPASVLTEGKVYLWAKTLPGLRMKLKGDIWAANWKEIKETWTDFGIK